MKKETSLIRVRNLKREECYLKRTLILCIVTVFIIFGACTLFGNLLTSAHGSFTEKTANIVRYKSVEIKAGDTLWNIAETYMAEGNNSVSQYVAELKNINSLKGDQIEAGCNLIIPY